MTIRISPNRFNSFKTFLEKNGYVFEERQHQEFLAKKAGISVNLYSNGGVVIGGNDPIERARIEEYLTPATTNTNKGAAYVTCDSQVININTPYNARFVEDLKANTDSRRWNPDRKIWTLKIEERDKALEILGRYYDIKDNFVPVQTSEQPVPQQSVNHLEIKTGDEIEVYTDGACSGNPGPGGYAAVIIKNGQKMEISGGYNPTTNNRMEMMAVIAALETLKVKCNVVVYSDSTYVVDSMSKGWARRWKANNWLRKTKPVPNSDLWERLLAVCSSHKVKFRWVKGHDQQPENERCNEIAEDIAQQGEGLPRDTGYIPNNEH